jgi:serine/threonine-protein kinase RsbT
MMQEFNGVHQPDQSRRGCRFEGSIVGSKADGDRDDHNHTETVPALCVPICSDADIVIARQQSRALAIAMKFSATDSAFIATTVSELARALLSHTARGEIRLQRVHEDERTGVVIVARDPVVHHGAGDRNAMNSRLVLPDVYRLVDEFDIASEAGRGTTIRAIKWRQRR